MIFFVNTKQNIQGYEDMMKAHLFQHTKSCATSVSKGKHYPSSQIQMHAHFRFIKIGKTRVNQLIENDDILRLKKKTGIHVQKPHKKDKGPFSPKFLPTN